jgi:hypothetical protein
MIFVFGSNLAGYHGAGAALYAARHKGALYNLGVGAQGTSYAIPTKDQNIKVLPLGIIELYVDQFLRYARLGNLLTFQVTRIGCGLAGYRDEEIAPMFYDAPNNCYFDLAWEQYLGSDRIYWGTFP